MTSRHDHDSLRVWVSILWTLISIVNISMFVSAETHSSELSTKNCYEIFDVNVDNFKLMKVKILYRKMMKEYKAESVAGVSTTESDDKSLVAMIRKCYAILTHPAKKQLYDKSAYNLEYALNPSPETIVYYALKNKFLSWISPWTNAWLDRFNLAVNGNFVQRKTEI